jgi:alpha-amylase
MLANIITTLIAATAAAAASSLPGCQTYHQNQCVGNNILSNASVSQNQWFTPPAGPNVPRSFQDYSHLVAYVHVQYTDTTRSAATVTVRATSKTTSMALSYTFGDAPPTSTATFAATSNNNKSPLLVKVMGVDHGKTYTIELEPVDFSWNSAALPSNNTNHFRGGQKGAIVEMFGWPDQDIEKECTFLSQAGYMGVKIYPHQEQVMSGEPFQNLLNPWYFMYQPVSYRLEGRMGSRADLRTLITACRSVGVRVYADAVINHFSGGGNDMAQHRREDGSTCTTWPNKSSSLSATWGGIDDESSPYYTQDNVYETSPVTKLPPSQEFPAAAIGPTDFHCERVLNAWNDPLQLNAGWLTGLTDLNTELEHVQERIAAYLTDLLSIGLSGFRVDAAKHMKPDDLVAIFLKVKRNMGGELPSDFITWWEILLGGESDLLMCNSASGYNYGGYLVDALTKAGFTQSDIEKIKIWNSGYPKETEKGLVDCNMNSDKIRSVIQNDDADQQNPGSSSRDMGDEGCVLIKGCSKADHKAFEIKLFNAPNGASDNSNDFPIRVILSSFYWAGANQQLQGIPDGKSDCSLCTTNCQGCQSVNYTQAFDTSSTGYDATYTRVHRDPDIVSAMRAWIGFGGN